MELYLYSLYMPSWRGHGEFYFLVAQFGGSNSLLIAMNDVDRFANTAPVIIIIITMARQSYIWAWASSFRGYLVLCICGSE